MVLNSVPIVNVMYHHNSSGQNTYNCGSKPELTGQYVVGNCGLIPCKYRTERYIGTDAIINQKYISIS